MSSRTTHPFLSYLELDEDADARAIRRAYARKVKLIDQERAPGAFQQLREAYECALDWAAHMEQLRMRAPELAAPVPAPVPAPVALELAPPAQGQALPEPSTPIMESPQELADAVFADCAAAIARLAQGRMLGDLALWVDQLQRRLDDERLFNIAARSLFEARIAFLLAGGWKAGHETLYLAACQVFHWDSDRRRLPQFGYAGAIVNRAIDESHMFEAQDEPELQTQRKVIARLRRAVPADSDQLRRDMFYLERMMTRFPNLMALTVNPALVAQWRQLHANLPAPRAEPAPRREAPQTLNDARIPQAQEAPGRSSSSGVYMFIMLLLFVNVGRMLFSDSPAQLRARYGAPAGSTAAAPLQPLVAPPWPVLDGDGRAPPFARKPVYAAPPAAPHSDPGHPLSRKQLDAIAADIHYTPKPDAVMGVREVVFAVELDALGALNSLKKSKASIDPDYDAAVARAIGKAPAFGSDKDKRFKLQYKLTLSKRAAPQVTSLLPASSYDTRAPVPVPAAAADPPAWPPAPRLFTQAKPSAVPAGEAASVPPSP
ncbi:MAG: hypothetical protein V4582_23580 [Pseudomonadota bacterium]